jgi:Ca2+-binding EF-hand superfamily protein
LILPLDFHRLERGHLTIDRLVQCGQLQEFIQLMNPSLRDLYELENNTFHPTQIRNIHKQYLQLDQDKNGLLNAKEMHLYGKKRAFNPKGSKSTHDLTSTFIQHVFEQTQTFPPENEMDYKAFLEFTTYIADKESIASLRVEYIAMG